VTLPNDGKAFTLKPGGPAVELTEYAFPGVLVINTATAGLVWLGAGSAVGPQDGIPLEPSTAAPWTRASPLFAVLDAAATAPVTLYMTASTSRWDPSPTAIGAAVAAQLLATGVPNVLVQDIIATNTVVPAGTGVAITGLNKYASIIALPGYDSRFAACIRLDWLVGGAGGQPVDTVFASAVAEFPSGGPISSAVQPLALPVRGDTLLCTKITAGAVLGMGIGVIGSNRPEPGNGRMLNDHQLARLMVTNQAAFVAGTPAPLINADGGRNITGFNGEMVLDAFANVAGVFECTYIQQNGALINGGNAIVGIAVAANVHSQIRYNHPALALAQWAFVPTPSLASGAFAQLQMTGINNP
jgi:hypothetical protein